MIDGLVVRKWASIPLVVLSLALNAEAGLLVGGPRGSIGTAILGGLFCIWFREVVSRMASLGVRRSSSINVPPVVFELLGWALLGLSFFPIFHQLQTS